MLFDFYDDFINKQWQSHINKIWFKNQYIKKPHWYSCAMLLTPRCGRRRWARSWLLWCPSRSRSRAWKRQGAGWSLGPGSAKGATAETGSTTNAALYQLHSRLSTGRMLEWKSRWALRELTKRFGRCGMQERRVACEPWAPRSEVGMKRAGWRCAGMRANPLANFIAWPQPPGYILIFPRAHLTLYTQLQQIQAVLCAESTLDLCAFQENLLVWCTLWWWWV